MLYRTLRTYAILILCLLCAGTALAQRRYQIGGHEEYHTYELLGITLKDVDGKVDELLGLHKNQYVGAHHLMGFSLEGSWTTFANTMPVASMLPGGGALGAHLLYEFQYSGLLVQTGIGVNMQKVYTNVQDIDIYRDNMHDKWETVKPADYTLKYEFRQRQDISRMLYGQIPLYIGQYIFGGNGVGYWLGGFHLNYAWKGDTKQTLQGTTMARYEQYLGVWHEMDNHGYRLDVPIERRGDKLQFSLDVLFHAETGYEKTTWRTPGFYRKRKGENIDCRMRFAAFADFGIVNICPRMNYSLCGIPDETMYDFPTYRFDHVFSTAEAKNYWVRNLFVGIRLTVLFAFPPKEYCILCDPGKH